MKHPAFSGHLMSIVALTALSAFLATGCSKSSTSSGSPAPPAPAAATAPPTTSSTSPQDSEGKHVTLYRSARTKEEMATADSNGMIAVSAPVTPGSSTPAKDAIEALISEPNSPIPPGTKLLRLRLASKTGIATVDFSSEFVNNFPGGDEAAAQVIDSIRSTLGQFHSIKKVRFFVEGKQLTEYGGAYDMTDPISVTHSKDASDEKDLQHDKRKGASSL